MTPLTSYQHAHDAAGERAADREDAIDACADDLVREKDHVMEIAVEVIAGSSADTVAEILAMTWALRLPKLPQWATPSALEYLLRNLDSNIYDALRKEATARVDARENDND